MQFETKPYKSAGDVLLGMHISGVRKLINMPFDSFKRTEDCEAPCDYYDSLGLFVYYDAELNVEAVELTEPASAF